MTKQDSTHGDAGEGGGHRPRAPRHSVMLAATVERFGRGAPTRHRVRDLSTGGVRIDQASQLTPGATVLVTVGALESVGATVVWVRDGLAGLKFAHDIDPDEARARTAIPARKPAGQKASADTGPKAGWMPDLRDPYRTR
jgi:hypothetical protein